MEVIIAGAVITVLCWLHIQKQDAKRREGKPSDDKWSDYYTRQDHP